MITAFFPLTLPQLLGCILVFSYSNLNVIILLYLCLLVSDVPAMRLQQGWQKYKFKKYFWFLSFLGRLRINVRTVARGTLDTGIRSRRRPIHED